jgi:hypothetical protein
MPEPSSPKPQKLHDQLRDAIHIKHYSYSTEKTYVHWAKRYILIHNQRHPAEMGAPEPDHTQIVLPNKAFLMKNKLE